MSGSTVSIDDVLAALGVDNFDFSNWFGEAAFDGMSATADRVDSFGGMGCG